MSLVRNDYVEEVCAMIIMEAMVKLQTLHPKPYTLTNQTLNSLKPLDPNILDPLHPNCLSTTNPRPDTMGHNQKTLKLNPLP